MPRLKQENKKTRKQENKVAGVARGFDADSDADRTRKTERNLEIKKLRNYATEPISLDGRKKTEEKKQEGFTVPAGTRGAGGHPFIVKVCDGLITAAFVLIFLGVPLFFTGLTLQGMAFEKQIFFYFITLIGFFAWILKGILQGKIIIKKTPLDIPILIFLAVMLINGIFSVNKWNSFLGGYNMPVKSFVGVLFIALFYWLLVSNINKKRLKIISFSLVLSIGLVVIFAILNFFSVNLIGGILGIFGISSPAWATALAEQSGFNTIGMVSSLEMFIAGGMLILLGVLGGTKGEEGRKGQEGQEGSPVLREGRGDYGATIATSSRIMQWVKNFIIYILLAGCLFSIFVLGSYISLISLIVGLGILLILCMSGLVDAQKKIFTITSILFAVILVYIFIGKPPITLKPLPTEVGLARSASWQISKETFKDKYLLGTGMGNYGYAFNKYRPITFNDNALWNTRFSEATGLFYEAIGTVGIVGIVAFILLLLAYLGVVVYSVLGNTNQRELEHESTRMGADNFLYISLFAASVVFGIDLMFYLTSGTLIVFCAIIAALGMAVIALNKKEYFKDFELSYNVKPEYALALSFAFICLSCAAILIFINLSKIYVADIYAKKALISETEELAVYRIQKAIKLNPYQGMYYQKLGDLMARLGDEEMKNDNRDLNKAQNFLTNALSMHKKAIELMPASAFSWENLGVLSELIVRYDPTMLNEAEAAYNNAIALDPLNPALRMRIAVVQEAKADLVSAEDQAVAKKDFYDNARTNFLKAIELKRNLGAAYDGISRLEEKLGNLDEAIKYMSVSYQLNADNAAYPFNLGRLYYNRGVLVNTNERELEHESTRIGTEEEGVFELEEGIEGEEGEEGEEGIEGIEGEEGEEGIEGEEGGGQKLRNSEIEKLGDAATDVSAGQEASTNDFKMAGLLFQKAVELTPNYADALYSLAMVYEQLGYNEDAKTYYKKTMDALPDDQGDVRESLRRKVNSL